MSESVCCTKRRGSSYLGTRFASIPSTRLSLKKEILSMSSSSTCDDRRGWSRRLACAAIVAGAATTLSATEAYAAGAGAWAKHDGPFSDGDFEGFTATASGLKYYDVEVGTGPKPQPGQKIKAHYSGYLLSGKKFDSSYDRGQPLPFQVGKGQVIVVCFDVILLSNKFACPGDQGMGRRLA
jgi:hypothetical protein